MKWRRNKGDENSKLKYQKSKKIAAILNLKF
jgi:hypothetical protein